VKLADGRVLVMAEALVESVAAKAEWAEGSFEVLGTKVKGADLAGLTYAQPIHDGVTGVIITGAHVELSSGTGAVHTAPGHGEDDYLVGMKFDLPMPMPVTDDGTFDAGGGPFEGLGVWDANPRIIEWLGERGTLVASEKYSHSYPHCAGAASSRSSSGRPSSGSCRWRRRTCGSVRSRPRTRSSGSPAGRSTASARWSRTVPTGASRASAHGASRSRCSPV